MKLRHNYHEEDVIEETLQNGGKSAMKRFNLTEKEVISIVRPFVNEIDGKDGRCSCERAFSEGHPMMCWMCDRTNEGRI